MWISVWNPGVGQTKTRQNLQPVWSLPPTPAKCSVGQVEFCTQVLVKAWQANWCNVKTALWPRLAVLPPQSTCILVRLSWSKRRQDFLNPNFCLYYQSSAILYVFIRLPSAPGFFSNYMNNGWSTIKFSMTRKRITALIFSILTGL